MATLDTGERLHLPPHHDTAVIVSDGVLYVALDDDEVVLTAGDEIVIPAGEPRRAWNAGDAPAQVETCPVAARAFCALAA
jgi:quercetin dioxygenase-like cupin family protein